MADNEQRTPPTTGSQTDNVTLRVIALAHSTNQNEDVNLVLDLGTTVTQLKEELQRHLGQHPRPDTQRLIYQGRPLTDGNAVLRQILRLEPATVGRQPPHVLHLVVRDDQPSIPADTSRPPPTNTQTTPTNAIPAPQGVPNPMTSAFNMAQQAFPPGHPAQAMLQHAMQHQMALQNHHQHFPNVHASPLPLPTFNLPQVPRTNNIPNQSAQGLPGLQGVLIPPSATNADTTTDDDSAVNMTSNTSETSMSMSVEETIGPNGERVRRVIHNGPLHPGHVPVERSVSAPGIGARTPRAHTPVGSGLPHPPVPSMLPRNPLAQFTHFQQPFGRPVPMPFGNIALGPAQHPQQARDPLLYLISSPTGPEAILFTSNHGYFTSNQASSIPQSVNEPQPSGDQATTSPPQPTPTPTQPAQPNPAARNNQPGQVALRPQAPPPGQVPAQPARREGEDIVAQVLQRSWLFLRLYMFIFVLSEPGTWRRYVMLLIASLVCLLPRNNPVTDLLQAARRHFDNLIGPPQPPTRAQRPPAQGQQATRNDDNADNRTAAIATSENLPRHRSTDARMPTPEEHARRLLRESTNRNPNVVRDTLYRIEQAVALFLASLVPGVGERHVRAREEARRLMQEEEERRRREEEDRLQAENTEASGKTDEAPAASSSPLPSESNSAAATSTGVETTRSQTTSSSASGEGLRMRSGDANMSAS